MTTCPKCHQTSGNSWSQCDGVCPMPMSPHYKTPEQPAQFTASDMATAAAQGFRDGAKELDRVTAELEQCKRDAERMRAELATVKKVAYGNLELLNEIEQLRAESAALKAQQSMEAATLDEQMKAAGMMTIDEMLAGTPLDAFIAHAGVKDLSSYGQWLEMKCREFLAMQAKRDLNKQEGDDLYEWVIAHAAVFQAARINFNAAIKTQD